MSESNIASEQVAVDLRADGLLWLINAAVLHPRGFALAVDSETGALSLLGDGSEPWMFANDGTTDAKFAAVEALFARARAASAPLASAPVEHEDSLSDLVAWVGGHRFDYVEHDTGMPKCRHKSHKGGYAGACTQAIVRQVFPGFFRGGKSDDTDG